MAKRFRSFARARAYVQEHGNIGYKAPLGPMDVLPASVTPDGRITVLISVPAGDGWPSETLERVALDGPDEAGNHASRLRIP